METKCPVTKEIIRKSVLSISSGCESKFLTEFEDLGLIGRGAFGIVKKCRNHLDECIYAVKIISLKSAHMRFNKVLEEVRVLSRLQHQHIVRYHQAWLEEDFSGVSHCSCDENLTSENSAEDFDFDFDSPCLYIQMEFCPRSLEKFLETSGDLDEEKASKLFCQIMDGVVKVHEAGIVHQDLSLTNILLDAQDNVRISDFGLAKLVNGVKEAATPELNNLQMKVETKADIYSLGFIFVKLFHNLTTQHERSEAFRNLREKKEFPECCEEHMQFMQQILSMIPGDGPTASGKLQQLSWVSLQQVYEEDSLNVDKLDPEASDDVMGVEDEKPDV